jgi:hypothetical protein
LWNKVRFRKSPNGVVIELNSCFSGPLLREEGCFLEASEKGLYDPNIGGCVGPNLTITEIRDTTIMKSNPDATLQ